MAKNGKGRRTKQFNPGARTLAEYAVAVSEHRRGAHDAAGAVIHSTPTDRRAQFAQEIWRRRHERYGERRNEALRQLPRDLRRRDIETRLGLPAGYLHTKFVSDADLERMERELKSGRQANPGDVAAAFEAFHGYPSTEDVVLDVLEEEVLDFASLGELVRLVVRPASGRGRVELGEFGGAMLASNGARNQLYVLGGDQSVDPAEFGIDAAKLHAVELLGDVLQVVYYTNKTHLSEQGGEAEYHHDFGEESGGLPALLYDTANRALSFAGGAYTIAPEGVRD